MKSAETVSMEGGCTCGQVRYRLVGDPLFIHCCHCSWCQRETGSAFAVNALIESVRVELLRGSTETVNTPSNSGKGQLIVRCPACRVAIWSHYGGFGKAVSFIRVGTLDDPGRVPPDIHIFTSTRMPWVVLPDDVPVMSEYYPTGEYWPAESLKRLRVLRERV